MKIKSAFRQNCSSSPRTGGHPLWFLSFPSETAKDSDIIKSIVLHASVEAPTVAPGDHHIDLQPAQLHGSPPIQSKSAAPRTFQSFHLTPGHPAANTPIHPSTEFLPQEPKMQMLAHAALSHLTSHSAKAFEPLRSGQTGTCGFCNVSASLFLRAFVHAAAWNLLISSTWSTPAPSFKQALLCKASAGLPPLPSLARVPQPPGTQPHTISVVTSA